MCAATNQTVWDEARLANPHGQPDKARRVQAMFNEVAPTYELTNRVLSAGRDAYWRRRAVTLAQIGPDDRVLDLACGTGDFARAFARHEPAIIVGVDYAERMLALAASRDAERPNQGPFRWCRGDALTLPFADASFSVVSCAFGVRNFQALSRALSEVHRVLSPGGRAVILEFTMPRSRVFGSLYLFYFRHILPRLARVISRDRTRAYDYLPRSVVKFIDVPGMIETLRSAGFDRVEHRPLTFGIVTVYVAWKA